MVGCLDECASEAGFTVWDAVMPAKLARDGTRLAKPRYRDLWEQVMLDVIVDATEYEIAPAGTPQVSGRSCDALHYRQVPRRSS